ncbi:MAG: hypothetical protein U0Q16_14955 [Bryobacteraceae bacterium]
MGDSLLWRLARVVIAALATVGFLWFAYNPVVEFSWQPANKAIGWLLFLALPIVTMVQLFRIGRWWGTVVGALASMLLMAFFLLMAFAMAMGGGSRETTAKLDWRGTTIRAELLNGGATTSFVTHVQHEWEFFWGVRVVRRLANISHCRKVSLALADGTVVISEPDVWTDVGSCSGLNGTTMRIPLKPWIYF